MLMHAIAHGACRDTVRESALNVDSGRKPLAPLGALGDGKARDRKQVTVDLKLQAQSRQPAPEHVANNTLLFFSL